MHDVARERMRENGKIVNEPTIHDVTNRCEASHEAACECGDFRRLKITNFLEWRK